MSFFGLFNTKQCDKHMLERSKRMEKYYLDKALEFQKYASLKQFQSIVQSYIDRSAKLMVGYKTVDNDLYKYWDGFHDCAEAIMRDIDNKTE